MASQRRYESLFKKNWFIDTGKDYTETGDEKQQWEVNKTYINIMKLQLKMTITITALSSVANKIQDSH